MPVMADIVLTDAQTTPVDHTYSPMSLVNDVAKWSDDSSGTVQSWPAITGSTRLATATNSGHKTVFRLTFPRAFPDDTGVCCTPRGTPLPYDQITIETIRSNATQTADFNDVLAMLADFVTDAQFTKAASGESFR